MRATEISKLLNDRIFDVIHLLFGNSGKVSGNEFNIGNIEGNSGKSLKIRLDGTKKGVWHDFATGEGGDLIGLWAKKRNLNIYNAVLEAEAFLGIRTQKVTQQKPKQYVKPKTIITEDPQHFKESSVYTYLTKERLLTIETLNAFKIRARDKNIVFPYFRDNELISAKYLDIERDENGKKKMWREKDTMPCLFGWQAVLKEARSIIICEGEIDAMTLYQYGYDALSVPLGAGGYSWLEYEFDRLSVFDEIYLCFDNDKAGQAAISDLVDRLGRHRCRVIRLPYKDPNDCLQKDVKKTEIDFFIKNAENCDPLELKCAADFLDDVIDAFYPQDILELGLPIPFKAFEDRIAFRPAELSVWCGINGHGKSQLLGQIMINYLINNYRIFVASLELRNRIFLKRLYRQISCQELPSIEYIQKISNTFGNDLFIYNLTKTVEIIQMIELFKYSYKRYGVNVFFIDSFMKCNVSEDDYRMQKKFVDILCDFKNEYNCHIHLVTHPRKFENEDRQPNKFDIKGSGAITDLADNCFTLWRNKKKERIAEKHTKSIITMEESKILEHGDAELNCWKQRNGEWEGKIPLWFDRQSCQFMQKLDTPKVYLQE